MLDCREWPGKFGGVLLSAASGANLLCAERLRWQRAFLLISPLGNGAVICPALERGIYRWP